MFVGMRDVILSRMELDNPYEYLRLHGVKDMEIRIQPDRTLDAFHPRGEEVLRVGSEAENRAVLDAARSVGVRVSGILLNTHYENGEADREEEVRWIDASAAFAKQAGLETIRIDIRPGKPDSDGGPSEDAFLEAIASRLAAHLEAAAAHGITLAIENHGHYTNRPDFLRRLLDAHGENGLRVTLDTGNFYCTGGLPLSRVYEAMERFAPQVTHVHLKNIRYPEDAREAQGHKGCEYKTHAIPIDRGDVDHARVFDILRKAGYAGGLYIEDESRDLFEPDEWTQHMTRTVGYLQGILAAQTA